MLATHNKGTILRGSERSQCDSATWGPHTLQAASGHQGKRYQYLIDSGEIYYSESSSPSFPLKDYMRRRRRTNLLDQFAGFDDYLEDPSVHLLRYGRLYPQPNTVNNAEGIAHVFRRAVHGTRKNSNGMRSRWARPRLCARHTRHGPSTVITSKLRDICDWCGNY